jgi:hypothetical protein|tara:strand:+ start:8494 stop:8994 length:501 start_codon:yes stop_codon:yes gene_type:complete
MSVSNQGSTAYFRLLNKLSEFLLNSPDVNTVTQGDITKINLQKQEMFPLCHIQVNNAQLRKGVIQFNVTVFAMDIIWQQKTNPKDTKFNNTLNTITNEIDIFNTQLKVVNLLNQSLTRFNLRTELFEMVGEGGQCEPFYERFENDLCGWAYTFDCFAQNNINVCQD